MKQKNTKESTRKTCMIKLKPPEKPVKDLKSFLSFFLTGKPVLWLQVKTWKAAKKPARSACILGALELLHSLAEPGVSWQKGCSVLASLTYVFCGVNSFTQLS